MTKLEKKELKKIEQNAIHEFRKSREFDNSKKMWQARGAMNLTDDLFSDLTEAQLNSIIEKEVADRNRSDFTDKEWLAGMTISERKSALINLFEANV